MDSNFYVPLLIGFIISGCIALCFMRYLKQKALLVEVRRNNELETIRIIYALKELLKEENNVDIYTRLSALDQTYTFPDIDKTEDPAEKERIQKEKEKLDEYLSVLELCSLLAQTDSISRNQVHIILGDRLEDIKSHGELYDYISGNPTFFKDLVWLLKG